MAVRIGKEGNGAKRGARRTDDVGDCETEESGVRQTGMEGSGTRVGVARRVMGGASVGAGELGPGHGGRTGMRVRPRSRGPNLRTAQTRAPDRAGPFFLALSPWLCPLLNEGRYAH